MSYEINAPEFRFEGFSVEWERSYLGNLCQIGDIDHRMPESKSTGIPYLMTGDFYGINGLDFGNAKLISIEDYELLSKKIKPEFGDILFARYASVGAVRYVETDTKFLISYSCAILKTNNTTYGKYLFYFFQTKKAQAQFELGINTGSQRNIGIDTLKSLSVALPKPMEQTQIGNYFQKLDTLINQHQQKHDKLSNLKKAMLEKMFPKAGETVPEIRFDGFSGEWEQVPFNEAFSFLSSNTLSRAELNYEQGKARNIHYGDILVKFGDVVDAQGADIPFISSDELVSKMSATKLQDGDVLFADAAEDASVGKCVEVTNVGEHIVFSGLHTIATRPNQVFASNYLGYYLNSGAFHQQLVPLMQGTKVLSISKKAISTVDVKYPSDRQEQEEIGKYFHQLDELINQHSQQITKLKNIKQACLDKMFV
ncbi:restriction endonuclease subunit S [Vibrio sp. D173a]|uniref:restriction endonuclease subunit S n=1 Tax=Vibrio sp. D173a TaxID=2836349 RepID=UPI002556F495|nr:restriction endonuclease subunit S [Vibrio sp. D173a]MDK9757927.1 restriction endonuclease subunit S [Vibrio sp. D173a]